VAVLKDGRVVSGSDDGTIKKWNLDTGECLETMQRTEFDVSDMDLSSAILTKDLAKLLWQNGAKISDADYERYVCSFRKGHTD
jgi:WD40 repeat protein